MPLLNNSFMLYNLKLEYIKLYEKTALQVQIEHHNVKIPYSTNIIILSLGKVICEK